MTRLFLVLTVSLFLAGCMPAIKTPDSLGGTDEYTKWQVVSGFPALPLYPKAQTVESYGYKGSYGASFISGDSLAKVVGFYNDSFKPLGWDAKLTKQSETNYVFEVKNDSNTGSVIVNTAADGKKTAITIFAEPY